MSEIPLGIGTTRVTLKAIVGTILKRLPIASDMLPENQKKPFLQGQQISVICYQIQDSHIVFESSDAKYFGKWYAFQPHVAVYLDRKLVEISTPLVNLYQLAAIAPDTPLVRLTELVPELNKTMARYAINTPLRICHFIAQIAHESDGFYTNEEYASGTDYEGRDDLGNTESGDGVRFKGRGLIQITGRYNYYQFSAAIGSIDLMANPDRLADNDLAVLSAGWFWDKNILNRFADSDDLLTITHLINGGYNGLSDRREYLNRAKQVTGI